MKSWMPAARPAASISSSVASGRAYLALLAYLAAITVVSLVGLAPPLLIRRLIDNAIPGDDGGQLNLLVLAMFVFVLLKKDCSTPSSAPALLVACLTDQLLA